MTNQTVEKKDTISGALGISDGWFESTVEMIRENWGKHETISDIMEWAARETRDEELGVVNADLTVYEKKLVMAGFIIAQHINEQATVINPMAALFLEFLKSQQRNEEDEE